MMDYLRRIADLLDMEPFGVILSLAGVIVMIAIGVFAWFLYWTWMFQYFGGR